MWTYMINQFCSFLQYLRIPCTQCTGTQGFNSAVLQALLVVTPYSSWGGAREIFTDLRWLRVPAVYLHCRNRPCMHGYTWYTRLVDNRQVCIKLRFPGSRQFKWLTQNLYKTGSNDLKPEFKASIKMIIWVFLII